AQSASHLRSASASAAASGSVAASTTTSAPGSAPNAPNTQQHTPLKKRKFKVVEQSGALVVGAPSADDNLAGVRDGAISFAAAASSGAAARASPAAPLPPPAKKSHKKQVKPESKLEVPAPGVGPSVSQSPPQQTQLPLQPISKPLLEGVLDKLQKKDTYGVFAEPVDAAQVLDYYDVIKDPMDFGIMRKKINKTLTRPWSLLRWVLRSDTRMRKSSTIRSNSRAEGLALCRT
ncbi:hypothetical protein MPTK1_3g15950, partial [Marchantia polymorpha subsp. ruderalis]